jgi:5-methylthioadenosine/S-adenosylhomocysteine deaminase
VSAQHLLLPRHVLPVRPAGVLLEDHAVLVEGACISAILPRAAALEKYPEARRTELPSHVLLPGLVNMHTHSPMSLLRGLADDLALESWLREHIWPAESRFVSPAFARDGTRLAMAEMLRGGTTCFNEMYFFPDEIVQAVREAGMRACIGSPVIDLAKPWAANTTECLARARDLHALLAGEPLLTPALAPHALYTVDDEGLAAVAGISAELGMPVAMHVLEIAWEIEHSRREYGKEPLQRLHDLGLLGPSFMAVHMAHLSEADIALVAESGTHVVHCPESNLKLSSGISPVTDLLAAGVNVSVGTDGAASNNNLDLLGELRTAALLAKGASGNPCAVPAWQALEMVTINAARALGLEQLIGSIEPGKQADLCAIDLSQPETQPLHNVVSQVVYAASSRQVSDVWVAGQRLLERGQLTTLDLDDILRQAEGWREKLQEQSA